MEINQSIVGGILIGLAAFLLQLLLGRVAGISGILGGLLPPTKGDTAWRAMFLLGLVAGGAIMLFLSNDRFSSPINNPSTLRILLAGVLVGFGTRLGSGCASGHGVCGLSRLSPRSLVATFSFVAMGIVFVTLFGGAE